MADVPAEATTGQSFSELGLFTAESLFVRFDFTKDALRASAERYVAARRANEPIEMPSEIKTYVHELTHYLQYTTTPYGLFLQYCRLLQSRMTSLIVRILLDSGIAFRMPLLENLPAFTGEIAKGVDAGLTLWLNVEHLLAMLHGDTEGRVAAVERFVEDANRARFMTLRDTFARVQLSMARLLEELNESARAAGNSVPLYQAGFDHEAIREEMSKAPTDEDHGVECGEVTVAMLGGRFDVEQIIESAATVSEFCPSHMDYDRFTAWANEKVDRKLQVYRTCIARALERIPTRDLMEFIYSYMALCELVLYAPLLPQHVHLRRESPSFRQILPILRWWDVINAAAHVEPMRAISDHGRYITEICRRLDIVHPTEIIKVAIEGPEVVSNPLEQIFLWAQQWRAANSFGFLGVTSFLFGSDPSALAWREKFNFVLADFSDCTTYHPDKSFLEVMTTRHLTMLAMRCIMLNRSLTISAPYRGTPDDRRWMTEWLRNHLQVSLGREFPMLQVV